ncbi:hypothetical protein HKD37_10G027331 [Glycine soja]|nr:hypothetical protein GmHk_10G027789 [Glycine max]
MLLALYVLCQIFSQHNIYEAGQKKVTFKYLTEKAADKEVGATGTIMSEGDIFLNGAKAGLMAVDVSCNMFHPSEHYPSWTVEAPTDDLKQILHHCTGWQSLARPADRTL